MTKINLSALDILAYLDGWSTFLPDHVRLTIQKWLWFAVPDIEIGRRIPYLIDRHDRSTMEEFKNYCKAQRNLQTRTEFVIPNGSILSIPNGEIEIDTNMVALDFKTYDWSGPLYIADCSGNKLKIPYAYWDEDEVFVLMYWHIPFAFGNSLETLKTMQRFRIVRHNRYRHICFELEYQAKTNSFVVTDVNIAGYLKFGVLDAWKMFDWTVDLAKYALKEDEFWEEGKSSFQTLLEVKTVGERDLHPYTIHTVSSRAA